MSDEVRKVILWCLDSEIKAFEQDLSRTGPRRDFFGDRQVDTREAHLKLLREAKSDIEAIQGGKL